MIRRNETAMGSGQTSNDDSRGRGFGTLDYVSVDGDDGSPGNKPNQGLLRFDNLFDNVVGQLANTDTIVSAKLTHHRCQCTARREQHKGNGNPIVSAAQTPMAMCLYPLGPLRHSGLRSSAYSAGGKTVRGPDAKTDQSK